MKQSGLLMHSLVADLIEKRAAVAREKQKN
jgi:hypothetical protein